MYPGRDGIMIPNPFSLKCSLSAVSSHPPGDP